MTREQALKAAQTAAERAETLAARAEDGARTGSTSRLEQWAAAGTLWAETSRAYSDLARVLPESTEGRTDAA
jgi:hypothetical protein